MRTFVIKGGRKLEGELRVNGGKNAVLPMFTATLLNGGQNVLHNVPRISDSFCAMDILRELGCQVTMQGTTVVVDSSGANRWTVSEAHSKEMRSSILFLGGLLGRFQQAQLHFPGGCNLGTRAINLHLEALQALGATIECGEWISARTPRLQGTRLWLDFPSVGATENIMLAATTALGETTLVNAAQEPEIVDLARFLNSMGADIRGAGTGTLRITGVKKLHAAEHCIMPDRIVAGTYLLAAAITSGTLRLQGAAIPDLVPILHPLRRMGCYIIDAANAGAPGTCNAGEVRLHGPARLTALDRLVTQPHPGFPTDMQAPFMAALSVAAGTTRVEERLFNSRTGHIPALREMGARITALPDNNAFLVDGVPQLQGKAVTATDLRCGAALVLAGLAAHGETRIHDDGHIPRGYEDIAAALRQLGADIATA